VDQLHSEWICCCLWHYLHFVNEWMQSSHFIKPWIRYINLC
jgi:hypothetical protein